MSGKAGRRANSSYRVTPRLYTSPRIGLAAEALRRHVAQRADQIARRRQVCLLDELGDAEIRHPYRPLFVQQQIRRFDVTVQHSLSMGIRQRVGDLEADVGHLAWRQLALGFRSWVCVGRTIEGGIAPRSESRVASLRSVEVATGDQLHYVVMQPVQFTDGKDRHDVGVM